MRKYDNTVFANGQPLQGVAVTVFNVGTPVLAALFADDGVTPLDNPVSTDEHGYYSFNVEDGRYDIRHSKSGFGTWTQENVSIVEVTMAEVTAEAGVVAAAQITDHNSDPDAHNGLLPGIGFAILQGLHTISMPAHAMTASTTDGAVPAVRESPVNKVNYAVLEFDHATQQYAEFTLYMPKSWDGGDLLAQFFWLQAPGATSFQARFGIQGFSNSDSLPLDVAFGDLQEVTLFGGASSDIHESAVTLPIVLAGNPAPGAPVMLRVTRVVGHADDTMDVAVQLVSAKLSYTVNKSNDA